MVERITGIDDLKTAIRGLICKDYGDFKRKVVLYLNRYAELVKLSESDRKIFTEMIDKIQFHPDLDVERTRYWSLEQLSKLKH